jgi:hypothetical protein
MAHAQYAMGRIAFDGMIRAAAAVSSVGNAAAAMGLT